jgi:hypothetical protein
MRQLCSGTFLALAALAGCAWSAPRIPIVRAGQPRAAVSLSPTAPTPLAEAARLLIACIEKSTGARLPLAAAPAPDAPVVIHVGQDDYTRRLRLELDSLGPAWSRRSRANFELVPNYKDPAEPNFLGFRDCSNSYFEWANRVAEIVVKDYPGAWFGALAYGPLAQPPGSVARIHPRIVI